MARKKSKLRRASTGKVSAQAVLTSFDSRGAQSGDLQDLPDNATADSESVQELAEEGQAFEAAVIEGIENTPPADAAEVTTKEVPEDDVPLEYLDQDSERPKD
jgi:hypothetical protein